MAYALGVDINSRYSQISAYTENDRSPVPISAVLGQDRYEIPTMVAYISDKNMWTYGYEALSLSQAGAATPVDDLLRRAVADETVVINGEEYLCTDLLELFIKKVLGMANTIAPYPIADAVVFCVEFLNNDIIRLLNGIIKNLGINPERTSLMSHDECIHHYMIHQPRDLWQQDVLILDYSADSLFSKIYYKNLNTKPIICGINNDSFPKSVVDSDEDFLEIVQKLLDGRIVSSVYLIGDDELEKNCPKTIQYIANKRRAFLGRNLYTRGACYASKDKINQNADVNRFLFLGADKVKCNVGLSVNGLNGEEFLELLEAGRNWYDVEVDRKFYLGSTKELRLILKPIDGMGERTAIVRLNDFPKRPDHTTYIQLEAVMEEPDILTLKVSDLGFGQIFPSSESVVVEKVDLSKQE